GPFERPHTLLRGSGTESWRHALADVPRGDTAAARARGHRWRLAGFYHLIRQHHRDSLLAPRRNRDLAHSDLLDAAHLDQSGGQCARHAHDHLDYRHSTARSGWRPLFYPRARMTRAGSDRWLDRLREELLGGPPGRRRFLQLLGAAAAAGVTVACRRRTSTRNGSIRFDGWGGSVQDALHQSALAPFARQSGVRVVEGTFDDEITVLNEIRT